MIFTRRMTLLPIFVLATWPMLASANDDICADIQRRLNSGPYTIGNSAETRNISRAINDQNALVRQIRIDMRRNGCSIGSVIVYGNQNAEFCGELGDRLIEARAELDYLTTERNNLQLSRHSDMTADERLRLEDDWEYYGCMRREAEAEPPVPPQVPAPMPQVVGRDPSPLDPPVTVISPSNRPIEPQLPKRGSLRTVCVRLCDGKFFPLSAHATPLDFSSQSRQCQQACPDSRTELYYHSLIGQETKDMISTVTGKAYASLPTAFRFQSMGKSSEDNCGCGPQASGDFGERNSLRPPAHKIEPGSAPQQQNTSIQPKIDEGRPYVPGERKVRSVGPQFFPQDSEMDLANPAVKGAQPQQ